MEKRNNKKRMKKRYVKPEVIVLSMIEKMYFRKKDSRPDISNTKRGVWKHDENV